MARGRKSRGRAVHGIILLDKPYGITSNQALQKVKRLFNAKKAGHTGSLDKQATGLLPICLGEATKLSAYLLDADKEYQARCQLGVTTKTGDAAGEVMEKRPVPELNEQLLKSVLSDFCGEIEQIPPMFSALKHKGERLYKLAYEGKEVERQARPVTIHELDLLGFDHESINIHVRCSKGTYIRTLAEDIGKQLGCGAHINQLRRTAAGALNSEDMVTLEELETIAEQGFDALDQLLLPMDNAVLGLPEVHLEESSAVYLSQGQAVLVPKVPMEGLLRLYDADRDFIGIGQIQDDGKVAPRRLFRFE